jgi:hypothetical protein
MPIKNLYLYIFLSFLFFTVGSCRVQWCLCLVCCSTGQRECNYHIGCELVTALVMRSTCTIFWDVMRCSLVEAYQHFRGMHHFHHQGLSEQYVLHLLVAYFNFLLDPEDGSVVHSSVMKMSVNFYQTTWFHVSEGSILQNVQPKFDCSSGFHKSCYFNLI